MGGFFNEWSCEDRCSAFGNINSVFQANPAELVNLPWLSEQGSDFFDARTLQGSNERVNQKVMELVPGVAVTDGDRVR
jgi:hypothetical protein